MHNPIHKGMIAEAIGMITDPKNLDFLNLELTDMNRLHRNGKFKGLQNQMVGVIKGLNDYKDPSTFHEMFYTAMANYPTVIRDEASKVLKNITNDPAPLCEEIVVKDENSRMVLEALYYGYKSESPKEKKLSLVQAALLRTNLTDQTPPVDKDFVVVRDESGKFLGELKDNSPRTIDLLEKKWKADKETSSRIITIEALQSIKTEESGTPLAAWLKKFIDRKNVDSAQRTTIPDEDKVIRAIIKALGDIPGEVGLEELFNITPIFGQPIVEEARLSLKKRGIEL